MVKGIHSGSNIVHYLFICPLVICLFQVHVRLEPWWLYLNSFLSPVGDGLGLPPDLGGSDDISE